MPTSQSSTELKNADAQLNSYPAGVDQSNIYTFEPGVMVLPVAEDPPTDLAALKTWSPVDVVRLHAPYRFRRVSMNTQKQNNPPVIPTPADTGSFVFVGGAIGLTTSLNQSFRNFDWTAVTEFMFVENCVSRPQDGLVLGTGPYQWDMTAVNSMYYGLPPQSSVIGAVANAGIAALSGYQMGSMIDPAAGTFGGAAGYAYNEPSFFPGTFFSDDLLNGGAAVFTGGQA